MTRPTPRWRTSAAVWIATGLGSGLIRPAPGTWGSLAALPLGVGLVAYGGAGALACAIIGLIPMSLWSIRCYLEVKGSASVGQSKNDPSEVVIDEAAGVWVALLVAPLSWPGVLCAFALFRFFDILKPWPVSWFDRTWKGPAGILADDLAAGLYAALCLVGMRYAGLV